MKKRYVIAGASGRALSMYAQPIARRFSATSTLVGVFDINHTRLEHFSQQCGDPPTFLDFDVMLRETRPDCVIVTTVDRYHHEYIIRALRADCDVITEKPMTIDAEKCRAILEAERGTGKALMVTFNYRFTPYPMAIKRIVQEGAIGRVLSVDFEWMLDRSHGADYFRRWHRRLENSGGLLVHKATHHFDIINWWLDAWPRSVYARGARWVYGPTRAERGVRCSTCPYALTCEFHVDYVADPALQALYFSAEHEDGYFRDACVFAEEIDIADTMSVSAEYETGALLTYSLLAYSPYEGWRATLTGTNGRMELEEIESGPEANVASDRARVFRLDGSVVDYTVPRVTGGHGGGDEGLLLRLFGEDTAPDPLEQMAGSRAGAASILIGIAANSSIASGNNVRIADLLEETPAAAR